MGAKEMKRVLCGGTVVPRILCAVLAVALGLSPFAVQTANADELYGRIRGSVTDASGGLLVGVDLRLTNPSTGRIEVSASSPDGSFTFVNLKPGQYNLAASRSGFKTFQVSSIRVQPNQIYV